MIKKRVVNEPEHSVKRHPIRVVSRRTGLSRDVLRAWESRYGLLDPERSKGGQRLYSDEDIQRLQLIRRSLEAGRRIGQVARLPIEELQHLVNEDLRAGESRPDGDGHVGSRPEALKLLEASLAAVEDLNPKGLETALSRAAVSLPASAYIDRVLTPLLIGIGDLWAAGFITPGHERVATMIIRRQLDQIRTAANDPEGPLLVVATPSGQHHELGAMLAAAAAATAGWQVVYLGPDLPSGSIAKAVVETGAAAMALSITYPPSDPGLLVELREVRRLLPNGFPVIVGGRAAASYQDVLEEIEAVRLPNEPSVRSALDWVRLSREVREPSQASD